MAIFVIVHGGWGGGWEWTPVARRLRERGHEVFTATLTGLGERAHLGSKVGLSDHIEDVVAVFTFEELRDVVLCGHSSGGMVVTGVADRVPELIRRLIYIDAFVPNDGQSQVDLMPDEFREMLLKAAKQRGDGKIPYPADVFLPEGSAPEELRTRYIRRTRPHPVATITEPIRLTGAVAELSRAYVRCTGAIDPDSDLMGPFAARAQAEGWLYRELDTPHDPMLLDPQGTAAMLDDLATASAGVAQARERR
jgi:pimeloyl-ACP methyl ester carboxylesterase